MNIHISTIPHSEQKYETVGDYWDNVIAEPYVSDEHVHKSWPLIEVVVSDLGDERMEFLIGIHEAIEAGLMHFAGIPLQASTEFDIDFEKERATCNDPEGFDFRGKHYSVDYEPGDSPDAPYRKQHMIATAVERLLAAELGIDWKAYEDRCNSL